MAKMKFIRNTTIQGEIQANWKLGSNTKKENRHINKINQIQKWQYTRQMCIGIFIGVMVFYLYELVRIDFQFYQTYKQRVARSYTRFLWGILLDIFRMWVPFRKTLDLCSPEKVFGQLVGSLYLQWFCTNLYRYLYLSKFVKEEFEQIITM